MTTPPLIVPTPVSAKNFKTASVKRASPNNLSTEQFPGLILPLAGPDMKPFFPLLLLLLSSSASPEIFPTVFHKCLISVFQPSGWKSVIDKLLKMSYSLVGRNVSSQLCGKDTFTGVTKKNWGQGTLINVLWPDVRKCVFTAMWQRYIHRCYQKALWVGHIYKCVIVRCVDMCLHSYVAKTHFSEAIQWKSLIFCVEDTNIDIPVFLTVVSNRMLVDLHPFKKHAVRQLMTTHAKPELASSRNSPLASVRRPSNRNILKRTLGSLAYSFSTSMLSESYSTYSGAGAETKRWKIRLVPMG